MPKKILVVDDDRIVVRSAEKVLQAKGYEVISASDGLEALVKIKNEKPDLVVLDVMMPEVNGYDVCYQLRYNEEFKKIPILLLTSREKELDEVFEKKMNIEYTFKPIVIETFIQKIKYLLRER